VHDLKCKHDTGEAYWRLAPCNEDGWYCVCGEKLGFRPDLDRSHTDEKVNAILVQLHTANIVYVSNGDMGEHIVGNVCREIIDAGTYDQYSIIASIMREPNMMGSHAKFWKDRALEAAHDAEVSRGKDGSGA